MKTLRLIGYLLFVILVIRIISYLILYGPRGPLIAQLPIPSEVGPPSVMPNPTIHQSWKTTTLPSKYKTWSETWIKNHPTWEYKLWTDTDNRNLVEQHYPWFLPVYDAFDKNIFKVDSVRYLYMHAYGGIYSDLDAESLKSLNRFYGFSQNQTPVYDHGNPRVILAYMGNDRYFRHGVPNAFLGATAPGHPFW